MGAFDRPLSGDRGDRERPADRAAAEWQAARDRLRAFLDDESADTTDFPDPETAPDEGVHGDERGDPDAAADALDEAEPMETGLGRDIKRILLSLDPAERPRTIDGPVHHIEFQDPYEDPQVVPDRYGTPLQRPDGTRVPLFVGEPSRDQAEQGALGDCGVIATLGAVAGHLPLCIRECVRELPDGDYEVRLHEARQSANGYEPTGRRIPMRVTADLPVFDESPYGSAFAHTSATAWPAILEKAVAAVDGTWTPNRSDSWIRRWEVQSRIKGLPDGPAPQGYVRLNHGSSAGDRAELLVQLTGRAARQVEFPTGADRSGRGAHGRLLDELYGLLAADKPVLIGTRDFDASDVSTPGNLVPGHVYEVTAVGADDRIHLRNPYGWSHPEPIVIREFVTRFRNRYSTLE